MRTKVRKLLDFLAYASLVLDVGIAVVTLAGVLGLGNLQLFLFPINYLLTVVVILSIILFVLAILERVEVIIRVVRRV